MRTLAVFAALLLAVPSARPASVSIVLSDTGPAYNEAAQAAESYLAALARTRRVAAEAAPGKNAPPDAVITLGTRALRAALAEGTRAPVIAALIPRAAYELELRGAARAPPVTAVFLDQPIARQLNLVRILLPARKHVGLLVSPGTVHVVRAMEIAARPRGLAIVHETVSNPEQISPSLSRVLEAGEVLLAVPDPSIYNAGTIHNILLTALRARQPLIGFSEAYVRAGALAAVYSRPQQAGRQAAEIASRAIAGLALPPPQDPQAFAVRVNDVLARSLGLTVASEEAVHEALQRMERER